MLSDDHSDYGSTVSGVSGMSGASGSLGKSPAGGGTFTFPPQPLTHKAAVYYHHQLALSDDQGIDMTQVCDKNAKDTIPNPGYYTEEACHRNPAKMRR